MSKQLNILESFKVSYLKTVQAYNELPNSWKWSFDT